MPERLIQNDPGALDEMMADLAAYDGPLGPGPYWAANQRATLEWLHDNDLNRFRTFEPVGKALANFGGGSWWAAVDETRRSHGEAANAFAYRAAQKLRIGSLIQRYGREAKRSADELRLRNMFLIQLEALCRARDKDGELDRIEASPIGSPSDALSMGGKFYTPNFLISFLRYLDMKEHIDFSTIDSYVEVGPGAGLFVEVLAKLRPELRIHLIDIPPQLYVLQQLLQAIFGDAVATYRNIKAGQDVLKAPDHRIFILAPWQIDRIDLAPVGLAHNSGFGEMRKDTVETYLSHFDRWRAQNIYICALDIPKTPISIKTDDYAGLLPNYELVSRKTTRDGASLLPIDSTGRTEEVRPASDVCFRRTASN